MNKLKFLFFFLFFFSISVFSQNRMYVPRPIKKSPKTYEIGIFLGGSYYLGDLNLAGHFNRFTRPAVGALHRINFNPRLSIKTFAAYGVIEGDDAYSLNTEHRNRNLSFKSKVIEISVQGEFNFLPYSTGSKKLANISPYLFAGFAVFHFDPKAYYQSSWYALQPLGTEGQGLGSSSKKAYSLVQFSFPFGIGAKFNTSKKIGVGVEWGLRRTFTDYLDDVSGKYVEPSLLSSSYGYESAALADRSISVEGTNVGKQRGNSKTKDWYSFIGVLITYRLRGDDNKCDVPH